MLKSRTIYGMLLICTLFLYLFFSDYISFIGIVVTAALLPLLAIFNLISTLRLKVGLGLVGDSTVHCNNEVLVNLKVENRLAVPISHLRVDVELCNGFAQNDVFCRSLVFPVASAATVEFPIQVSSDYCGQVKIKLRRVRVYDMLGITVFSRRKKRLKSTRLSLTVLPSFDEIDTNFNLPAAPDPDGDRFSNIKAGDDPSQILGYHEYMAGDKRKNIYWKLSSKLDTIMVKELSLPLGSSICQVPVLGDSTGLAKPLSDINLILSALAAFHAWLLENGMTYDLCVAGSNGFELASISKADELYGALQSLYEQSPAPLAFAAEQIARAKRRYSRCYCAICYSDIEASLRSLELIKGCCQALTVVVVGAKTDISELLYTYPEFDFISFP